MNIKHLKNYSIILVTRELRNRFRKAEREENKYSSDPAVIARYVVPQGSIYATGYEPKRSCFAGYIDFGPQNRGGGFCKVHEKMLRDRNFNECMLSDLLQ